MADRSNNNQPADAFAQMWGDFFSRMTTPPAAANPIEMSKQMQQAFLDALARYCDEFMRSEQFLQMMKQTMDGALAFRRQLDGFLKEAQQSAQAPTRDDVSEAVEAIRGLEERLMQRLEAVEHKVNGIEDRLDGDATSAGQKSAAAQSGDAQSAAAGRKSAARTRK